MSHLASVPTAKAMLHPFLLGGVAVMLLLAAALLFITAEPTVHDESHTKATEDAESGESIEASAPVVPTPSTEPVIVVTPSRMIPLKTSPAGATVFIDDREAGVTPFDVEVLVGTEVRVSVILEGYEAVDATLGANSEPLDFLMIPVAVATTVKIGKGSPSKEKPAGAKGKDKGSKPKYSIAP